MEVKLDQERDRDRTLKKKKKKVYPSFQGVLPDGLSPSILYHTDDSNAIKVCLNHHINPALGNILYTNCM